MEQDNYNDTSYETTDRPSTTGRNVIIGLIALVILVGLGYIFRPYSGTVAGVSTTQPNVPSETAGTVSGTVVAPR